MHVDDLRRIQREAATANLYGLVASCRGRFVEAADLLEWRSAAIERLREAGVVESIDLWPLYGAYTVLSERYIAEFFSPRSLCSSTRRKCKMRNGVRISITTSSRNCCGTITWCATCCVRSGYCPAMIPKRLPRP